MLKIFWAWYERHYALAVGVALALFLLQVVHLVWLLVEVIWTKLSGAPLFMFGDAGNILVALVDYTEIPAIIGVSLVYINELRRGWNGRSALYLFILNT